MRALKFSVFFLALLALTSISADKTYAQCNGASCSGEQSEEVSAYRKTYSTQSSSTTNYRRSYSEPGRVSHNSRDSVYKEKGTVQTAPAMKNTYTRSNYSRTVETTYGPKDNFTQESEGKTVASNTVTTPNKDGSMFGGTCGRSTKDGSMFGGDCSRGKDGSMFGGDCSRGKDGSMFGGSCSIPKTKCYRACKQKCGSPMTSSCQRSCKPCFASCSNRSNTCMIREEEYRSSFLENYDLRVEDKAYDEIHKCQDAASLDLKFVDFRIKKDRSFTGFSDKLGNYRFRIFGCRRFDKQAMLNQGRLMQKDMQFIRIFEDMMSDCYNIVKSPTDLCLNNNQPLPEYVLTAEITDYFMNVCDKYDWDSAKKENLRTGSSEITITWRLTDVTGTEIKWQGESTGYAEIEEGEYNGELVLVERAFADAVNTLRNMPGFKKQLSKRVSIEELNQKRIELVELEKIANPIKCQYKEEIRVAEIKKECGKKTICKEIDTCTDTEIVDEIIVIEKDKVSIDENAGAKSSGNYVSEDGGSNSSASVSKKKEIIEISEDGGANSSGHHKKEIIEISEDGGAMSSGHGSSEEVKKITITEIDEDGGAMSSGHGSSEEVKKVTITEVTIDEDGGAMSSGHGNTEEIKRVTIIDEDSGAMSSGAGSMEENKKVTITETIIDEDGGAMSSGHGNTEEIKKVTITEIDEDGGIVSAGAGNIQEVKEVKVTETIIDENSGIMSAGAGGLDENTTTVRREITIDEDGGIMSAGSGNIEDGSLITVTETIIDENSGISGTGMDENSGSMSAGAFDDELWIQLPREGDGSKAVAESGGSKAVNDEIISFTGETGNILAADELCIVDRPPYETLSAENVYKMRASIVNITNINGRKGSGLIISNQFVLTSADLITKDHNRYDLETINGVKLKASAFRINPNKNIALLLLDEKTRYNPLPLNLNLPPVGRSGYLTLGMLDQDHIKGKLEDRATIAGYRFSDEVGSEIIVDTDVQKSTVGGALIDSRGTINGIAHTDKGTADGKDLFLPITSAIKSVGLSICGKEFPPQTPWYERSTTPISRAIDNYKAPKDPGKLKKKERK